jgi:hypothetical protein
MNNREGWECETESLNSSLGSCCQWVSQIVPLSVLVMGSSSMSVDVQLHSCLFCIYIPCDPRA